MQQVMYRMGHRLRGPVGTFPRRCASILEPTYHLKASPPKPPPAEADFELIGIGSSLRPGVYLCTRLPSYRCARSIAESQSRMAGRTANKICVCRVAQVVCHIGVERGVKV